MEVSKFLQFQPNNLRTPGCLKQAFQNRKSCLEPLEASLRLAVARLARVHNQKLKWNRLFKVKLLRLLRRFKPECSAEVPYLERFNVCFCRGISSNNSRPLCSTDFSRRASNFGLKSTKIQLMFHNLVFLRRNLLRQAAWFLVVTHLSRLRR